MELSRISGVVYFTAEYDERIVSSPVDFTVPATTSWEDIVDNAIDLAGAPDNDIIGDVIYGWFAEADLDELEG